MRVGMISLLPGEYDPGDPGKFVGERDRVDAEGLFLAELPDPVGHGRGLVFDMAHHGGRPDDEQPTQVSISLLRDAAKSGLASGGMLLRCQPEPGGELSTRGELLGIGHRCGNRCGCDDAAC
jgi:hypothetical protein